MVRQELEILCINSIVMENDIPSPEGVQDHYVPANQIVYLEDKDKYFIVIRNHETASYTHLWLIEVKDPKKIIKNNNGYWHKICQEGTDYRLP